MAIYNTFEVIAHRASQSSCYLVTLQPIGVKLNHVITYPKVTK